MNQGSTWLHQERSLIQTTTHLLSGVVASTTMTILYIATCVSGFGFGFNLLNAWAVKAFGQEDVHPAPPNKKKT